MKRNQTGFSVVEVVVLVVVVGLLGLAGWMVFNQQEENSSSSIESSSSDTVETKQPSTSETVTEADITKDWTEVKPNTSAPAFSLMVPKSLLPNGTCTTQEVLLSIIYNSDSNDYDCDGVEDALSYASIVFGVSEKSIIPLLGTAQSTDSVTLADNKTTATKSVVTAQDQDAGGANITIRYVIYEAVSEKTGKTYYSVYKTAEGMSDEDQFLKDYEATVTKGWTIP